MEQQKPRLGIAVASQRLFDPDQLDAGVGSLFRPEQAWFKATVQSDIYAMGTLFL